MQTPCHDNLLHIETKRAQGREKSQENAQTQNAGFHKTHTHMQDKKNSSITFFPKLPLGKEEDPQPDFDLLSWPNMDQLI
jgi:hypothetical protein